MRKTILGIVIAAATLTLAGCPDEPAQRNSRSPHTLNLILGGPFVFVRQSNCLNGADCLEVWIPDVPSHSKPVLFGFQGQFYELERLQAGYTLTGMVPAANYIPLAPVTGSSSWIIPGKTLHASSTPTVAPYLILRFPIPKEIVPWNADPLDPKITSPVPYAPGKQSSATMTILRYDYDDSQLLELTSPATAGSTGIDLHFEALTVGNERALVIQVIPQKPLPGQDEHIHSREAYKAALATLGMQGDIDFPPLPAGYKRNYPINSGVLPDDLVHFINSDVIISRGRINDCKAMAIFVDATK
jgi:hypothetical protein